MISKINQSFIKDMREYKAGVQCGNLIFEKYCNDRLIDLESDSVELGSYFEYILSGALPKDGQIPQPQYMASAIKANKGKTEGLKVEDMYSEYRKAHANADRIRKFLDELGLKIIKKAHRITKGRFVGDIDLICECTKEIDHGNGIIWKVGDKIVIDLKYSGLINDRWSKHGWSWENIQKTYHGTQAKQYHYLTGLPHHFLVCQSNAKEELEADVKLFYVPVDEHMIEHHIAEANELFDAFLMYKDIGFEVRPSFSKCKGCPLRNECKDKHTFPRAEVVDLNIY